MENCTVGQATDDNMARAFCSHALRICSTHNGDEPPKDYVMLVAFPL